MKLRILRRRRPLTRLPTVRPMIGPIHPAVSSKTGDPADTGAALGPLHPSHREVRKGLLSHVHDTAPPAGGRTPT
jgi:hypothetical protein